MSRTPLQRAQLLAVPAFKAALRLLRTRRERDALRDALAAALAASCVEDIGYVVGDDDKERAA